MSRQHRARDGDGYTARLRCVQSRRARFRLHAATRTVAGVRSWSAPAASAIATRGPRHDDRCRLRAPRRCRRVRPDVTIPSGPCDTPLTALHDDQAASHFEHDAPERKKPLLDDVHVAGLSHATYSSKLHDVQTSPTSANRPLVHRGASCAHSAQLGSVVHATRISRSGTHLSCT